MMCPTGRRNEYWWLCILSLLSEYKKPKGDKQATYKVLPLYILLRIYWNCDKGNSYNIIMRRLYSTIYEKINCSKIGNIIRFDIEDRLMKVLRYVNVIVKVYQTTIHTKLSSSKSNIRPFFRYQQYLRSIEYFLSSIRTIV